MHKGIIYPELSYSIIGAAMSVHNELGPGWDEWDYHRAMIRALKKRGHTVRSHDRKPLEYRGLSLGRFELDLLIDDLVVLELKHLKTDFDACHQTQLINYLKCWDMRLGILINYGQDKLRYERLPYDSKTAEICLDECHASMSGISGVVHRAVVKVMATVGFGYSVEVFKKLLYAEMGLNDVNISFPTVSPGYDGEMYEERELDAVLVENGLLVTMSASSSAADLSRLRAYMKHTDAQEGLLVDMSESNINLRGVRL